MSVTTIRGQQVKDGDIGREDLNTTTAGRAVVRKIIAGTNITITETGADSGTGDVTINASGGGGGITTIGTINSQSKSANGAVIAGSSLVLQTADATFPGLVSTGIQTIAGAKTFTGQTIVNVGNTTQAFQVVSTDTQNTVSACTITANSGTRSIIASTNGQAQYAARSSSHTDRELRFQLFSDGNCYFGMQGLSGNQTADLIIRTSHDAAGVSNNGSIRFTLMGTAKMAIGTNGIAIGSQASALSANAYLHLMAGVAAANGAPLRFTSGTNLTTPVAGAMEYNGTNLFFTRTGTTRESVWVGNAGATAPATAAWATPSNYYGANITNVLGTPNSWASVVIGGTTYKIPLYT